MKNTLRNILVAAVLGGSATIALAADKVLTVASFLPPTHGINASFWPTVKEELEKRTDGRVSLKVEYGLSPPNGLLELVEYGGADIAWTFNGYMPGRFVTTKMIELPGFTGNSEAASVAHWRAQEKYFNVADEYAGVKLIGLMVHAPAVLLMGEDKKINSLKELEGRKMRIAGGVASEVAKAMKLSPVMASVTKSYEMVSGGMTDGTMLPMDVVPILRLNEVAPNGYSVPGGFYRGSFGIFMNEDAMDGISEADQKAMQEYFGEKMSADGGKVWDVDAAKGEKFQLEKGTVTEFSKADIDAFAAMTQGIKEKVISEVSEKGINGQEAYDFIKTTMENY